LFGAYPKQQIYTINADESNLKILTNNQQNEVYNVKLFGAPDNSRIAYHYNKPGDLASEHQDIYLLDINRETAKNLTQKPRNYDELSWWPDDQLIAFVAGEFNNQKLYTISAAGNQLNQLAPRLEPSGISELAWSADSQEIAFIYNEIQGDKSNLYVINRDGSGLSKLTNDKDLNASSPVWQPQ